MLQLAGMLYSVGAQEQEHETAQMTEDLSTTNYA
jgi:hypothetical protein